jgi:hypothetical protein
LPGDEELSGTTDEAVVGAVGGPEPAEASMPRSLACSAAAAEEELPGAGAGSGFGAEAIASGFGFEGGGEEVGAEGELAGCCGAAAGAGLEAPPVSCSFPPVLFPPEDVGALAGTGAAVSAGAGWSWTGPLE